MKDFEQLLFSHLPDIFSDNRITPLSHSFLKPLIGVMLASGQIRHKNMQVFAKCGPPPEF